MLNRYRNIVTRFRDFIINEIYNSESEDMGEYEEEKMRIIKKYFPFNYIRGYVDEYKVDIELINQEQKYILSIIGEYKDGKAKSIIEIKFEDNETLSMDINYHPHDTMGGFDEQEFENYIKSFHEKVQDETNNKLPKKEIGNKMNLTVELYGEEINRVINFLLSQEKFKNIKDIEKYIYEVDSIHSVIVNITKRGKDFYIKSAIEMVYKGGATYINGGFGIETDSSLEVKYDMVAKKFFINILSDILVELWGEESLNNDGLNLKVISKDFV